MATERHDKEYGYRTMLRVIVVIGAVMGIGLFIFPNVEYGSRISPGLWVLIATWAVILVTGIIWAGRAERRYRCRKCGARLPMLQPEAATKYEHRFYCPACDIVWTTNVFVGD